jgi:hypothetical protein
MCLVNVLHHIFVTSSLIHIDQKEKIALEIAIKVASVNGPLKTCKRAEK